LEGNPISAAEFEAKKTDWLPSDDDQKFIQSLMHRVTEPGKMAGWIAPPDRGINAQVVEYEYVKL
jgi:benzoyl-CoA 2,3-epoxidase subunit B